MKKAILILTSILCLSLMAAGQENYKLGDFNKTQVKVKELNLGGSWTTKKSNTTFSYDLYYGLNKLLSVSTIGAISGTVYVRDSVSFTTSETRVAKYIAGATSADVYVVTPQAPASSGSGGRPVAGDLTNAFPKTDSVVFMRAAGTTSGLTVYFLRIK